MTESTLLLLIFCFMIGCVLAAHWLDRRIVKKIEKLEVYQIKKGILNRHFVNKKSNQ